MSSNSVLLFLSASLKQLGSSKNALVQKYFLKNGELQGEFAPH